MVLGSEDHVQRQFSGSEDPPSNTIGSLLSFCKYLKEVLKKKEGEWDFIIVLSIANLHFNFIKKKKKLSKRFKDE